MFAFPEEIREPGPILVESVMLEVFAIVSVLYHGLQLLLTHLYLRVVTRWRERPNFEVFRFVHTLGLFHVLAVSTLLNFKPVLLFRGLLKVAVLEGPLIRPESGISVWEFITHPIR